MLISTTPLLFSLPVLFSSSYVCFFVHFPSMILFRHFCFRSKSETIMLSRNFFHFETPDILVLFSVSGIWCIWIMIAVAVHIYICISKDKIEWLKSLKTGRLWFENWEHWSCISLGLVVWNYSQSCITHTDIGVESCVKLCAHLIPMLPSMHLRFYLYMVLVNIVFHLTLLWVYYSYSSPTK